jgi:hypothetical protein
LTAALAGSLNEKEDDMHDIDDITERSLRGLFARATVGEEPPLGSLIGDARRAAVTMRRRRRLVRVTGSLAAAAVVAAAIPALGAVTGSGGTGPVLLQTAYAVSHIEKAVAGENYVLHAETVVTGAGTGGGGRTVTWAYRGRSRYEQYRPGSGQLETDSGTAVIAGKLSGVVVTYQPGTWYRMPLDAFTAGPVNGCGANALAAVGGNPPDWPSFIRATLACGAAAVAGRAEVNGAETIKVNSDVIVAAGDGSGGTRLRVRYTLYVNPATYLPVRMVSGPVLGLQGGQQSPASFSSVADFQWLPPTAANVAEAGVPIPAGFRQLDAGIQR